MTKTEKRGLGRGLSALMADVHLAGPEQMAAPRKAELHLPVEKLEPNPQQPRLDFKQDELESLADSIRQKGVIQPLIVRRKPGRDTYEIVAGERRWRAAQLAQLHEVPVVVRDLDDTEVLEVAIIENIQRADLNAIEEALGFRQLMTRFGHTQEKLAEALSKSRSHVANLMRLLSLPTDVQDMVRDGGLSAGHARALIGSPKASELAAQIVAKGLSVRDTEKLMKAQSAVKSASKPASKAGEKDADTRALEADLSANLRMQVKIDHAPGAEGGQISIRYDSLEDLDMLCQMLSAIPDRVARD
ncbi:MAG: ParB/RepB/Spo0J family partition protein [Tabrizicola sp.]|uniref:ParB/RepB/Spo0J family partition protein n=1 Tax=Tabrizicola sp. TaxID=2005166 RepID=UPI001B54170E|nr:ParB/RepB/Spo0J family partition protein [Hyphomonadaceae bacterium]MCC6518230.1 ParB/RepB/Spo0J family partition protein [Tabrizicola sp.]